MNDLLDDDEKLLSKKKKQSESGTPVLDNFSRDLIKLAEEGKLDPVIGRDKEILRIAQILSRRKKNNPIIIGDPGVGKTNLIEGLAMKIVSGECPKNLSDKRIVNLDLTSVVAGTKYRGQFEERMKVIIEELRANPNIIVFIDEIHTLVGSGNSSGSMDGANIFKPALARGELQCIGATTLEEYKKHIEKDGALERRFQKLVLATPNIKETIEIIKNLKSKYEDYHKVSYSEEVIETSVKLADRYITDRYFPDKAFDVIDEIGARMQINVKVPVIIEELKKKSTEIKNLKLEVVRKQNYEEAASLRDKEKKILSKLEDELKKFEEDQTKKKQKISLDDVYEVVSSIANVPVNKMTSDDYEVLSNLETELKSKVIGQDDAVTKIARSLKRNRLGIKDPNRPIGTFVFLGSTGVGKTHLAKEIAKQVFGSEDALIRIDMSEYRERHSVSKMIGTTAGYVGYDDGGILTDKVKNKPYSVILFDEIEKAHSDIFTLLLQILDEGHVTDGQGRKINFKNTLIILTSNIGVKKLQDFGSGIGFKSYYGEQEAKKDILLKEMKKFFLPEFINRIDETIVFNSLTSDDIKKITKIELDKLISRVKDMKYNISYDESVIDYLSDVGYDSEYGARPLKRAIQEMIEDFISEGIISKDILVNKKYTLIVDDKKVKLK
jgi:ATP-dependent Clp protease ATP-binding subunit ClpC